MGNFGLLCRLVSRLQFIKFTSDISETKNTAATVGFGLLQWLKRVKCNKTAFAASMNVLCCLFVGCKPTNCAENQKKKKKTHSNLNKPVQES